MTIKELFCYPTHLMYARPSSDKELQERYQVTSVLAESNKAVDMFRKIVRVSDGASQYVNLIQEPNTDLFWDRECSSPFSIAISDQWTA